MTPLIPRGEGRRLLLLLPAMVLLVTLLFWPLSDLLMLTAGSGRFEP